MRPLAFAAVLALGLATGGCKSPPPPPDTGGCVCPDTCKCDHCQGVAGASNCQCRSGGSGHPGEKGGDKGDKGADKGDKGEK